MCFTRVGFGGFGGFGGSGGFGDSGGSGGSGPSGAYASMEHLRGASLGWALALPANIILGQGQTL
jgi:hypothetical protein